MRGEGIVFTLTLKQKLQLLALIKKYDIELVSFNPGEITVRIHSWKENESLFSHLISYLTEKEYADEITQKDGLIFIRYSPTLLHDKKKIKKLLLTLEHFNLL